MFEHAVEYNQQFAHGRDQRHLFRLASCQQPLVEVPDSRVVAAGYQRSHVEDGPHPRASAPDGAFAPQGATVPVVGGPAAGYVPIVTGDPEDVPRLIEEEKPHLVLLDLMLPGSDGIELMHRILKTADVPVIFVSVYS